MEKVKNQHGFTLVETVLALAITALLIAGAMVAQSGLRRETSFNTAIDQIQNKITQVKNEAFSGVKAGLNGAGRSNKDVFGKLVEFDNAGATRGQMRVYTLIGDAENPNAPLEACDEEVTDLPNQLEFNGPTARQAIIFTRQTGSVFAAPVGFTPAAFAGACSPPDFATPATLNNGAPGGGGGGGGALCPAPLGTPRGNDCQRIADLTTIHNQLLAYAAAHGNKLPTTLAYGGDNPGGWDYSSQPPFLLFLGGGVPLDPINNGSSGDVFWNPPCSSAPGNIGCGYGYFCYPPNPPWAVSQWQTLALGAKLEQPSDYTGDPHMTGGIGVYWYQPGIYESGSFTCSSTMPSPPTVDLSPTSYEFPGAWHLLNTGGSKPTKAFTVTNSGTSAVELAATPGVISGPDASSYSITSETCPAPPATLAPGANCSVTVRFFPPSGGANNHLGNAGLKNATLTINDSGGASLKTASLAGWAVSNVMAPDDYLVASADNTENFKRGLRGYSPTCYNNAFTCPSALILWNGGDLVLYSDANNNVATWGTGPNSASFVLMEGDGNLVMFDASNNSVWASSWQGAPLVSGAWLKLYDGGALRLLNPAWDSGGPDSYLWSAPGW